jgi:kynurenine formamidase
MCHHCVTESVKRRMLSRRDLLRTAPLAAAAPALAALPAAAGEGRRVVDLTHALHPAFPTYFGEPGFAAEQAFNFADHGFNLMNLTINEHTGTHLDAPLHFSADGQSVDEVPAERLVAPVAVIDIRARAAEQPDAQVTPEDVANWTRTHGDLPPNSCVAMLSGWGDRVDGPGFRNADANGVMHFPGFHAETARMLMEETGAIGLAVDTLSLDHGPSADFAAHYAWLPTNRWGLENVANLEALPPSGATMIVGAPKHRGGTGGPARVLALV